MVIRATGMAAIIVDKNHRMILLGVVQGMQQLSAGLPRTVDNHILGMGSKLGMVICPYN